MATRILFISQDADGEPLELHVALSAEEVFKEWTRAGDLPFRLEQVDGTPVYINPATVAFWEDSA
jgi:hypothetical protein